MSAKPKTVKYTPAQIMRDTRLRAGLSQTNLAKALGVSQVSISGFERGDAERLSSVKLWAFAKLFELYPADLGLDEAECCPKCGRPL